MSLSSFGGRQLTSRGVGNWTRHEVRCTSETIASMTEEAYQSCTFGHDEPPLIRMGKGFHETMLKRFSLRNKEWTRDLRIFNGALVLLDERFDSWTAHLYTWDRESYELPILFVGATVKLVDGQ